MGDGDKSDGDKDGSKCKDKKKDCTEEMCDDKKKAKNCKMTCGKCSDGDKDDGDMGDGDKDDGDMGDGDKSDGDKDGSKCKDKKKECTEADCDDKKKAKNCKMT